MSTVAAAAGVAPPFLLKAIIDRALLAQDRSALVTLIVLGFIAVTVRGIAGVVSVWMAARIGNRVTFRLRVMVFRKLVSMRLLDLKDFTAGQHLSRLNNDVAGAQQLLTTTLASAISDVLFICAAGIALFAISWQTAIVSLAFVPPAVFCIKITRTRVRAFTTKLYESFGAMGQFVGDRLNGAAMVTARLFSSKDRETNAYAVVSDDLRAVGTSWYAWNNASTSVLTTLAGVTIFGAIWVASELTLSGRLSVGDVVAIGVLLQVLLPQVGDLAAFPINLAVGLVAFERVLEVLEFREEDTPELSGVAASPVARAAARNRGDSPLCLSVRDVSFRYDGDRSNGGPWSVADVSFEAVSGSTVALVGPSGSGKTTILSLLARLYSPTVGTIALDGNDIGALPVEAFRARISFVTQQPYLLKATIRDNILYGAPDANEADLQSVCSLVGLEELIDRLPMGLDTDIGEFGGLISGGERQRIALARAFIRDAAILLCDEVTANLDPESARSIDDVIQEHSKSRVTVVAAHRLATVRSASEILFLQRGRVEGRGAHEHLVATHPMYRSFSDAELG